MFCRHLLLTIVYCMYDVLRNFKSFNQLHSRWPSFLRQFSISRGFGVLGFWGCGGGAVVVVVVVTAFVRVAVVIVEGVL